MQKAQDYYPDCPEAFLVSLARTGDRRAFAEIVRRRQSSLRNLLRRFCNDYTQADELACTVFLKLWPGIRKLRKTSALTGWLQQMAVSVWLEHNCKKGTSGTAAEALEGGMQVHAAAGMAPELDRALGRLAQRNRLCVVLSYHEGLSHSEIANLTHLTIETVENHIRSGADQLQDMLLDCDNPSEAKSQ